MNGFKDSSVGVCGFSVKFAEAIVKCNIRIFIQCCKNYLFLQSECGSLFLAIYSKEFIRIPLGFHIKK